MGLLCGAVATHPSAGYCREAEFCARLLGRRNVRTWSTPMPHPRRTPVWLYGIKKDSAYTARWTLWSKPLVPSPRSRRAFISSSLVAITCKLVSASQRPRYRTDACTLRGGVARSQLFPLRVGRLLFGYKASVAMIRLANLGTFSIQYSVLQKNLTLTYTELVL